ncbi:hypothetical protein MMC10_002775 [Thelotrema lepadinum]|nr:hypothetical protein [Thelotrema lepadinum]
MSSALLAGIPLSEIPTAPNLDGSPPNFDDPESLATTITATLSVFATLATLSVATRFYTNTTTKRGLGLDDWLSLCALVLQLVSVGIVLSVRDMFRHAWNTPASAYDSAFAKKTYAVGLLYGPAIFFARTAILVLQLRVFECKKWFRRLSYGLIALIAIVNWSSIPVWSVLCAPRLGGAWDLELLIECVPLSYYSVVVAAMGTFFDIVMLILPQPIIWSLNLSLKRKVGLALTFMIGVIATIASALNIYYRIMGIDSVDVTWDMGNSLITVFVEAYVIIIVGCVPALATLWKGTSTEPALPISMRSLFYSTRRGRPRSGGYSKQDPEQRNHETSQARSSGQYDMTDSYKSVVGCDERNFV